MTLQNVKISFRTDELSNWISANPVLHIGELAVVNDPSNNITRLKIGDGESQFTALPYINQNKLITELVDATDVQASHIEQGANADASPFGIAGGAFVNAKANFSQAFGINAATVSDDSYAFVWNGNDTYALGSGYVSHGKGTFNINALSGLSGVYFGTQSLADILEESSGSIVTIDDRISGIFDQKTDLSIIKLSSSEYEQLVDNNATLSNALYIVENDFEDAYGHQIKNLAPGTSLSDATNLQQLCAVASSIPLSVSQLANDAGYTTNVGTITGITMNGASKGISGVVDLGTVLTAHQSLSNYYVKSETSSASEISNALSAKAPLSSVEHVVTYILSENSSYTAVTIGSRDPNFIIEDNSFVQGSGCAAEGTNSHAEGNQTLAIGNNSHAEGYETSALGDWSHSEGRSTLAFGDSAHAEGSDTSALASTSHSEGFTTIANNQGAHAEGGYTSAFGFYSHAEGGWTSTGAYAIGAHAEGGFTRANGPVSHVEGIKATSEISDFQSFVWQGTDYMPQDISQIDPSDWDEYKAHGPGTFNINPVNGAAGVYIGEHSLNESLKVATTISFDDGTTSSYDWRGTIGRNTMVDAGLYDESDGSWIKNIVDVQIGNSVTAIGSNVFESCSGLTSVTIPDSVTIIEDFAFTNCSSLTSMTIPGSVTSIGEGAFSDCYGLDNTALSFITIDKGNWIKLADEYGLEYYKSNQISDDQSTSMSVIVSAPVEGNAIIKLKTSSEENYDFIKLYVDNTLLLSVSGNTSWQELPVTVPSGDHIIKLTYEKDSSSEAGLDCGYFAIVPRHIIVKGKTQEEAESLLAFSSVPDTCKILTLDKAIQSWGIGGSSGGGIEQTTWSDLLLMRDNSELTPGKMYQITDYVTVVDQAECSSAMHPFDLIVTALSEDQLDEHARATMHDGDTYFAVQPMPIPDLSDYLVFERVPLESWDIRYCIDNDKMRFNFADESNGKGVIYWMKDEFGNEAPYDFKNVLFKRYAISAVNGDTENDLVGMYGLPTSNVEVDESDAIWCYTFNGSDYADFGLAEPYDFSGWHITIQQDIQEQLGCHIERLQYCSGNIIKSTEEDVNSMTLASFLLPSNVFHCAFTEMPDESLPFLKYGLCLFNKIGYASHNNTFGYYCGNNTFDNYCESNIFGNYCSNNTFGNECSNNTFGNECNNNTFYNYCDSNIFDNNCSNNTFGNDCDNNIFGYASRDNTFGYYCGNNTFDNYCESNTFGNSCYSNTFGNECNSNTFGNDCAYVKFGTSSALKSYYQYITLEDGCNYIYLNCTQSTYDGNMYKNVTIEKGVHGINTNNRKLINDNNVNQSFKTTYKPANSLEVSI